MDKKYIFFAFFLIFSSIFLIEVRAEKVLLLMFTLYKNDSLSISNLQATDAPALLPENKGDYRIDITDNTNRVVFSTKMDVKFIILSDPPIEKNESLILLKAPWNEQMSKIKFYHLDNLIYAIDLCNKNSQCESSKGENSINCPTDCHPITTTSIPVVKPKAPIYIYLIIVAIVVALAAFFLYKIRVVK
jgi:hypothetical protein